MSFPEAALDPLALRLARRERIAADTHLFELVSPSGADLPAFAAGAHLPLVVPNGATRRYSLVNDSAERHRYQIAVKREAAGRGGSISFVDEAKPGDLLRAGLPANDFPLAADAGQFVFIAGGIGIAPIVAMIRQLSREARARFKLYYLTRNRASTAFAGELAAPQPRGHAVIHHDEGDPGRFFDFRPVLERPGAAHVYCCGPRPLMQAVNDGTAHWPLSRVHFEDFGTAAVRRAGDRPFRLRLSRSGRVLDVPAGRTILEVLRAQGVVVPSSCENGTCGSCRTRLVNGRADHRDLVLAESERADSIMVCVSRAAAEEITIDR